MAESVQALDQALTRLARRRRRRRGLGKLLLLCLLFAVGTLFFRDWLGLRTVEGMSMEPGLRSGDLVFFLPFGQDPQYGQVVLVRRGEERLAVKRVVGLSGDWIQVSADGRLRRNGRPVEETYARYGPQDNGDWISFPYQVPEGTVFCLGDNRPLSLDSRIWGGVSLEEIRGRVFFSLHPLSTA